MRLGGITNLEDDNLYLQDRLIRRYNRRFRKGPQSPEPAYRSRRGLDLEKILAFRYQAVVRNDNAVRLGGLTIDIPPGPRGRSYAKARVEVRQHLDGSWTVYYHDQVSARAPASPLAETMRCLKRGQRKRHTKGARDEIFVYLPDTQTPRTLSLGS